MMWVGDQNMAWDGHDGLLSALNGYLTAGMSGFSLTHSDVGGYTALTFERDGVTMEVGRSEELVLRWMELSAFADCMFRSHEGNKADAQIQVWDNERLSSAFAYWATFHGMLGKVGIKSSLLKEAEKKGWPIIRGMWWDYADEGGWGIRQQLQGSARASLRCVSWHLWGC